MSYRQKTLGGKMLGGSLPTGLSRTNQFNVHHEIR